MKSEADSLSTDLPDDLHFALLLAQEKGASSWLISLPILEYGRALHKGAFHDALALRYGWLPSGVPSECVCGKVFQSNTPSHAPEEVSQSYATMRFAT